MIDKKQKAIRKAQSYSNKLRGSSHDQRHIESMLAFAEEIAKNMPEVDFDILEIACRWHDVGRVYTDRGHEKKSAEMAFRELKEMGFSQEFAQKVYHAIISHSVNLVPSTMEGRILKDADKLDYLPAWRWRVMIKNKEEKNMEAMMRDIVEMRDQQLYFHESKIIFDKLYKDLKVFLKIHSKL